MSELKNLYACAFCEESYSKPIYLVNHVQIKHVPEKPFQSANGKETKINNILSISINDESKKENNEG